MAKRTRNTILSDLRIQLEGNTFMVILNTAGGTGDAQKTYNQQVAPVFEQANVEVETVVTRHVEDATEIVKICV
ncbi:hypothetical protein PsorP6_016080 [Peronosclerospora sorghi]|uniref:Uncharacterized protein n=1 Tax=Peronosclerospora sorghi TaxID=230839 RepID=A0ACC0WP72_9STRA|nr:hypothetical protein PsorP6_016080 [Peronosclerospora sorghi]